MKYNVEVEIHWGDSYEIEASNESEAGEIARVQFLKDYDLQENMIVGLLGVDIDVEEI